MKKTRRIWKKLPALIIAAALFGTLEIGPAALAASQNAGTEKGIPALNSEEAVQLRVHSRVVGARWRPDLGVYEYGVSEEHMRASIDFYVQYKGDLANELVGDNYTIQWIDENGTELSGLPENAGSYTVKIILDDSLAGKAELVQDTFSFNISKLDLAYAVLMLYGTPAQWTGAPVMMGDPYVANSAYTLPEDCYELQFIEGENCTEVGTAYVKAVAKGPNVKGERKFSYTINNRQLDRTAFQEKMTTSFAYNGMEKQPVFGELGEEISEVQYLYYFEKINGRDIRLDEAPVDVGNYSAMVRLIPKDTVHYNMATWMQEYEITPRKLEAEVRVKKSKTYDGWPNVDSPEVAIRNLVEGDEVNLYATAQYDNTQAGKNKTISVSYQMSGKDAGKYIVPDEFTLTDGEIVPRKVNVGNLVLQSYYYNGSREVPLDETTVTNKDYWVLENRMPGDDVVLDISGVRAFMEDADAGINKPVTFTGFQLTGVDSANYTLEETYTSAVTIRQIEFSNAFQAVMEDYPYGSSVPTPVLSLYQGDGEIIFKYRPADSEDAYREWKNITPQTLKPGKYEMIAEVSDTVNYKGGTTVYPGEFEVKRFSPALEGSTKWEKCYGDGPFYLNITQRGDGLLRYQVIRGEDVVSVDEEGKVTIQKAGEARIYVSAEQTEFYEKEGIWIDVSVAKAPGSAAVFQEGWIYHPDNRNAKSPVPMSETNDTSKVSYQYKPKDAANSTYTDKCPVNAGAYTVKAVFAETENYLEVTATADFTILKAQKPQNMPVDKNTLPQASNNMNKAGDVPLPEGWSWKEPNTALIPGGILTAEAVYGDTSNYEQYQVQMKISKGAEIITSATDNEYVIGTGSKVVIKCTGALSELKDVRMDGVSMESPDYTLEEGSTILSFSQSYLEGLSLGKHTVSLSYTTGDVETILTVKKKNDAPPTDNPPENPPTDNPPTDNPPTDNPPENPPAGSPSDNNPQGSCIQNANSSSAGTAATVRVKTGDDSLPGVYALLLLLSAGMMTAVVFVKKNN